VESAGCLWASLTSQRVAANAGSKLRTKGKSGVKKTRGNTGPIGKKEYKIAGD